MEGEGDLETDQETKKEANDGEWLGMLGKALGDVRGMETEWIDMDRELDGEWMIKGFGTSTHFHG